MKERDREYPHTWFRAIVPLPRPALRQRPLLRSQVAEMGVPTFSNETRLCEWTPGAIGDLLGFMNVNGAPVVVDLTVPPGVPATAEDRHGTWWRRRRRQTRGQRTGHQASVAGPVGATCTARETRRHVLHEVACGREGGEQS